MESIMFISLSNHVTKESLTKWSSFLTCKETTDQYEAEFNEYLINMLFGYTDNEFNVYHDSGDVNEEEINILFNQYMEQEQIIRNM